MIYRVRVIYYYYGRRIANIEDSADRYILGAFRYIFEKC
jgi:hypothetical protein